MEIFIGILQFAEPMDHIAKSLKSIRGQEVDYVTPRAPLTQQGAPNEANLFISSILIILLHWASSERTMVKSYGLGSVLAPRENLVYFFPD